MHGPYRIGATRWWLRDGVDFDTARAALVGTQEALTSGALVDRKHGRRKGLFDLALGVGAGDDAPDHLLKRNAYEGIARLRRSLRGSKARGELERAERAAARGIATPLPLAAGEVRWAGLLDHCLLLMPRLEGAVDLRVVWESRALAPTERRAVATAFGALSREAVEAGLFQDDFAPNNVLLRRGSPPELWMIDFERAELRDRVTAEERTRMLAKLQRELVGATRADRLRFLRAFDPDDPRGGWRRAEAEAPRLLQRDLAHLERTLRRPGRRFAPLRDGAFFGWQRRDVALADLRHPRDASAPLPGRRDLPPVSRAAGRRLFATAVLLARRGLGPRPLAWFGSPERSCLLSEPADVQAEAPESPAGRVLLRSLLALADLEGPVRPGDLGRMRGPHGEAAAVWQAPERLIVTGRSAPPERHREILSSHR